MTDSLLKVRTQNILNALRKDGGVTVVVFLKTGAIHAEVVGGNSNGVEVGSGKVWVHSQNRETPVEPPTWTPAKPRVASSEELRNSPPEKPGRVGAECCIKLLDMALV